VVLCSCSICRLREFSASAAQPQPSRVMSRRVSRCGVASRRRTSAPSLIGQAVWRSSGMVAGGEGARWEASMASREWFGAMVWCPREEWNAAGGGPSGVRDRCARAPAVMPVLRRWQCCRPRLTCVARRQHDGTATLRCRHARTRHGTLCPIPALTREALTVLIRWGGENVPFLPSSHAVRAQRLKQHVKMLAAAQAAYAGARRGAG